MAKVLGVVSSIVTGCQVIASGVRRAKELYEAPDEVRALQVSRWYFDRCTQSQD